MGAVVAGTSQPALGAIKLAWWRAALERLDEAPPPGEPRLVAAARDLLPHGIRGEELAGLEAGWAALLDEQPERAAIARRGEVLFALAARLLGATSAGIEQAGALFASIDAARRGLTKMDEIQAIRLKFERSLRPITMLAALAARDAGRTGGEWESEATPGRAITLLRHRMTGIISAN